MSVSNSNADADATDATDADLILQLVIFLLHGRHTSYRWIAMSGLVLVLLKGKYYGVRTTGNQNGMTNDAVDDAET